LLFTPKDLWIRYAKSAEEMKIIKEDFYLKKIKNNNGEITKVFFWK